MCLCLRSWSQPTPLCHYRHLPLVSVSPQQEMRDKEARQRDKAEAHLYCMLKVASGADFAAQVREAYPVRRGAGTACAACAQDDYWDELSAAHVWHTAADGGG